MIAANIPPPGLAGIFWPLTKLFGGATISGWAIANIVVSAVGLVLYYIPKIGPFWGIKDEDIYIWPEMVMNLICTGLLAWGSNWWGGILMWLLWVFVWFLSDPPIWEAEKSRV
ncbi:MAG: hypothetical protein ACTSRG_21045 [Candidatus Helarchaeota archaeon]